MTVNELSEALSLKGLVVPNGSREFSGAYIGDLLSWVMGRAQSDNVWITIMSNINIVAVATLADVACIILAEDVVPDAKVLETALQKGVNIFTTCKTAFEIAAELAVLTR